MISVPVMSAGIRSGVNWMRLNDRFSARARVLIISVLARPGHAFQQAMAAAEERDQQLFDDVVLADDDLRKLIEDLLAGLAQLTDGGIGCAVDRSCRGASCERDSLMSGYGWTDGQVLRRDQQRGASAAGRQRRPGSPCRGLGIRRQRSDRQLGHARPAGGCCERSHARPG